MKNRRGGFITMLMAGALVALPTTNTRVTRFVTRGPVDPKTIYTKAQQEYWMTADEFGYTRPGYHVTINSVTVNADRKVVVDMSFTDDLGQPLDRAGNVTPGKLSTSFILAKYDGTTHDYAAYTTRQQTGTNGVVATQAGTDSGGTYQDVELGRAIYTFGTALPAGYDATKTTTLGIYGTRDMLNVPGGNFSKNYYANTEYSFRPDGGAVTEKWDLASNAACNGCHTDLSAHGGQRKDVALCVLCHSNTTVAGTPNIDPDSGNTIDFKVMIHKIHRGEDLPSVQAGGSYYIIGFQNAKVDFSTVAFPQDIRNCTTCHNSEQAPGAVSWYTNPSAAACTSCHDDVNLATGANHPAGPQPDGSCAGCHRPQGDQEWDASIIGAHTVPEKSRQLKGLNAEIVSVTHTAPGQNPTVVFNLKQNDGTPIAPSDVKTINSDGTTSNGLNVIMSGPTTDYAIPPQIREAAGGATPSGANYSYTFTAAIPPDANGTWGFSIEARRTILLDPHPRGEGNEDVRESASNPVFFAAVTDPAPVPRRVVVDVAKCNTCHDRLVFHGGNRTNPQECVFCHNPMMFDDQTPPESLDFKRMIHRLHTGDELTQTYLDFNGLRFPGDRRDCNMCHTGDSQQIPDVMPAGRLATATPRDWYSPQQPTAAACLGCHDSQAAAAHAFVMTAPFGESCATCHGPDADFSVDKMHAQ
jgi:OmcA/MtrC family decaheme c-type cytochrome